MPKNPAKLRLAALATILYAVAAGLLAALPPKYLGIAEFQKCLSEKEMGSYRMRCLPAEKPAACPADSWRQLSELTGADKVPSC